MPTVNLYYRNTEHEPYIGDAIDPLKEFIADQLSCTDRALDAKEVTIRDMKTLGRGMLADIEMDITAAPYDERVERQDDICLEVQSFAKSKIPTANEVLVWLNLHELGHSFKDESADE